MLNGGKILDLSLDPGSSPPVTDIENWLLPIQDGAYGAVVDGGFLTCGGRIDRDTEMGTKKCSHKRIGSMEPAVEYPDLPYPLTRGASTTVNGKLWITGGMRSYTGRQNLSLIHI